MATITWLVPSLTAGSGGHRTILQHAAFLEQLGHQCVIYLEDRDGKGQPAKKIETLFGYQFTRVFYGWNNIQATDIVIATIWYSARVVANLSFDCKRIYFVQDYEAYFNPVGDGFLMAENSYTYGLIPISIGRWLRHELRQRFEVQGYHFDFGADNHIYRPLQQVREQAICFIYQPDKPRRCAHLGLEALGIVKRVLPEVKIYLYGSEHKGSIRFEHEHLGLLDLDACNELYNQCSVGLCISSSNPSRIPFEMMAAGLPVVEIYRENNLYDLPPEAVTLCHQSPESLAYGLIEVLQSAEKISRMSEAGIQFMQQRSLNAEMQQFYDVLTAVIDDQPYQEQPIERLYLAPKMSGVVELEHLRFNQPNSPMYAQSTLKRMANSLPYFLRNPLRKVYFMLKNCLVGY